MTPVQCRLDTKVGLPVPIQLENLAPAVNANDTVAIRIINTSEILMSLRFHLCVRACVTDVGVVIL